MLNIRSDEVEGCRASPNWLPAGHALNKAELLFEKIEDQAIEKQVQKLLDTKTGQ